MNEVLRLLGSPGTSIATAPMMILTTVLFVTGIPPTEVQAVASRGEDR